MSEAVSLLLVDASIYLFRAFFSLPKRWHDEAGNATHAVLGFTRALLDAQQRLAPTHIVVAFDASLTTCFRNQILPSYKAQRPQPDPDIIRQQAECVRSCEQLGWFHCADERYEADDLLASALCQWRATHPDAPAWLMTRDKDFGQLLLAPGTRVWNDGVHFGAPEFTRRYGVQPAAFPDYQALVGDASDNVPGVSGVGPKTAAQLIGRFESLETLYEQIEQVRAGRTPVRRPEQVARDLLAQQQQAFAMREILRLYTQCSVVDSLEQLRPRSPDVDVQTEFYKRLGLSQSLRLPGPTPTSSLPVASEGDDV